MSSSSLKRAPASRTNRARSPGPSTPEGNRRSSQNAIRRGPLARCNRPVRTEHLTSRIGFVREIAIFPSQGGPRPEKSPVTVRAMK
jgi:hypothetical protein